VTARKAGQVLRVSSRTSVVIPALPEERALPRQAMWFFVAAPPILALLFDPECVKSPIEMARALAALTLYTVITGVAVHASFEQLASRIRGWSIAPRIAAHAAVTALVVSIVTLPQLPLVTLLYPHARGGELSILGRGILVSFFYLAIASFIGALQKSAVRERVRAHAERTAALEARLAVLSAQTQPHFLFNSLNTIASLVHVDPDRAEHTIERLADLLRYALGSHDRRLVSLGEELDVVRDYLEIQRLRFGDRLRFRIDASDEARAAAVPPMLVQPLVENAIVHGISSRKAGGEIVVTATRGEALEIRIEDDGVGPGKSVHTGTGHGLKSARERLAIVFGDRAALETRRSDAGGFSCTVRVR
jgi:two-component sensor histidine kinase